MLSATYVMNILDWAVSIFLFSVFTTDIELNPLGVILYDAKSLALYKFGIIGFALLILYKVTEKYPKYKWACWIPFGVYTVLTMWHVFGMISLYAVGAFELML